MNRYEPVDPEPFRLSAERLPAGDHDLGAYAAGLRDIGRTGRCPVWTGATPEHTFRLGPRPVMATSREPEAADVLAEWWGGPCRFGCGCRGPFQDGFPTELARADADHSRDDRTIAAAVALAGERRWSDLRMVACDRPASVPAALGWTGICNYPWQDLAGITAVLRSWERRFGALLVGIDHSTLMLAVGEPPRTVDECLHVAAEHFAFCPDQPDPQDGRLWTIPTYAAAIRDARTWRFWWD